MNDDSSKIKTGILVLTGVALFLVSILFIGGDRAFFKKYVSYKVKFKSTQGLAAGSVVSLSGIEVGNVKSITFDENASLIAMLNVDEDFASRLSTNTIASIRTQGALGDKYVYLVTGLTPGEPLKPNDFITTDPEPDFFDMISGKANDLSVFVETLRELNHLLHNLNADGKSAQLMTSIVSASQNIGALAKDPNIRGSFNHLKNVLQKIDNGDGTLGMLVNDATLHNRLVKLLGDVPRNQYLKPLLREAIKQNEKQH